MSVGDAQSCKNSGTDQGAILEADSGKPEEPCIGLGSDPPRGTGNFLGVVRPSENFVESLLCCMLQKKSITASEHHCWRRLQRDRIKHDIMFH